MSHSSGRPSRPVDHIWLEALREFGRPVAVLPRPEPGWRRLVGQGSVDGLLRRLDLGFYAEHTMLVQVTTQRRLPEHVRVSSTCPQPWDRRGACSGDPGLLAGEALQVGVAGFLPQHAGLRSRAALGGDVLQHRGEDVDPRAGRPRRRAPTRRLQDAHPSGGCPS